jgi:hypothetical protein
MPLKSFTRLSARNEYVPYHYSKLILVKFAYDEPHTLFVQFSLAVHSHLPLVILMTL